MALSDTEIRALKSRENAYQRSDGRGLVLEVMPGGAKVWRFRYRERGRPQKVTLGHYPEIPLAKARLRREELRVALAEGRSPVREKREAKQTAREHAQADNSVSSFTRFWFTEVAKKANKDPRNIKRYIEGDIVPVLGGKQLALVTPNDILSLCDKIKKRGADQSALQVRNILKRVYEYAIARQRVTFNPAAAIQAQYIAKVKSRERALNKDEVGKLLRGVYSSNMRRAHKLAIHLLLLTMVRKADLIGAKWEEVDLESGQWNIPETKTGKPHIVYLSRQAIALFRELKELAMSSMYVLPSRSSLRESIALSTLNVAIRAVGIEIADFVLHDFRRTASTHLHEAGFPADVVEKALAHTIGGIRGVYNRAEYGSQRKQMLQQWADMVDAWINVKGAEVVTLGVTQAS
jgi:integrase